MITWTTKVQTVEKWQHKMYNKYTKYYYAFQIALREELIDMYNYNSSSMHDGKNCSKIPAEEMLI